MMPPIVPPPPPPPRPRTMRKPPSSRTIPSSASFAWIPSRALLARPSAVPTTSARIASPSTSPSPSTTRASASPAAPSRIVASPLRTSSFPRLSTAKSPLACANSAAFTPPAPRTAAACGVLHPAALSPYRLPSLRFPMTLRPTPPMPPITLPAICSFVITIQIITITHYRRPPLRNRSAASAALRHVCAAGRPRTPAQPVPSRPHASASRECTPSTPLIESPRASNAVLMWSATAGARKWCAEYVGIRLPFGPLLPYAKFKSPWRCPRE